MVQPEKGLLFSRDYFYAAGAVIGSLFATKVPQATTPPMNATCSCATVSVNPA